MRTAKLGEDKILFTKDSGINSDHTSFNQALTQDAFLNSCIKSKKEVDIYIQTNHIYSCQILAHDTWVIMIKMGEKVALLYKSAVQAIVPEQNRDFHKSTSSGQILADVRTQYMRNLTKNRTFGSIKGN